jgi:hypothetical protein
MRPTMNNIIYKFDTDKKWEYENGFYLTSHKTRIPKLLAHYELYKSIINLPGEIIECGVYKGASLMRFLTFREALESSYSRKIIGFDAFGKFPLQENTADNKFIKRFEEESGDGISKEELDEFIKRKKIENYELIKGDILETIPKYLETHPELKIALLHIDVDVYEPTKVILENLFSRVVKQGIIILDDYGTVDGETRAVDEFFSERNIKIEKMPLSHVPSFIRV